MRIIISIVLGFLAISVVSAQETNQIAAGWTTNNITALLNDRGFSRCFSKGGLGIVNTNLCLVTKSATNDANELLLVRTDEPDLTWKGESITKAQVVVFYEMQIWSKENLPAGFDLSKSIVVSFEKDKIRFFDFQEMFGGYYPRLTISP